MQSWLAIRRLLPCKSLDSDRVRSIHFATFAHFANFVHFAHFATFANFFTALTLFSISSLWLFSASFTFAKGGLHFSPSPSLQAQVIPQGCMPRLVRPLRAKSNPAASSASWLGGSDQKSVLHLFASN